MAGCTLATWPAAMRTASSIWWTERRTLSSLGGENLYPVQIEDFLRHNPKVHDVAVTACRTSAWGKSPRPLSRLPTGRHALRKRSTLSAGNCRGISVPGRSFLIRCPEIPPARLRSRCFAKSTARPPGGGANHPLIHSPQIQMERQGDDPCPTC